MHNKKALEKYLKLGVFGYYKVPVSYQKVFMKWEQKYHNYKVNQEWLRFSPGVVPAIN
ncbi:putative aminotransferase [Clostridium ljungdahlii DSM 13528]|uniref:Putative aminotransferase n=1 Tax=Clostridium ljungdahlii (strain ATCC 55383 / DSM 13528 / PETC) TaxID=748727 RepID=D8GP67_CLOLD|nr:putative aminotransferase [Clostridium ljungdahlii DSM 13528]